MTKPTQGARTDQPVLAQSLLDDLVVVQGDPLVSTSGVRLLDTCVTPLVEERLDGLEVGFTTKPKTNPNNPDRIQGWSGWCPSQDVISSLPTSHVLPQGDRPNDYSPVGDVWLDETKHLLGGLGDADEDAVVDLEETEELQDLAGLGGDLGDTGGARARERNDRDRSRSR